MEKQIKIIIDNVGRFIIGEVAGESAADLSLKKPVIIHVQPNQQGQIQVQTLPLFFGEFQSDPETNIWTFNKTSIAYSSVKLDSRLIQQYESVSAPQPAKQSDPQVIKLFDE